MSHCNLYLLKAISHVSVLNQFYFDYDNNKAHWSRSTVIFCNISEAKLFIVSYDTISVQEMWSSVLRKGRSFQRFSTVCNMILEFFVVSPEASLKL